ncbi:hypothetical protein EV368DRAFT_88026 [Lentinula lateritia]|nr:hypothetical protein EV368DRAFT_88026 [Lentinula lateritia]
MFSRSRILANGCYKGLSKRGIFRIPQFYSITTVTEANTSNVPVPTRAQKNEGAILDFFSTLDPNVSHDLPARFSDLKAEIWNEGLLQSWKEVLAELETETERIASLGSKVRYMDQPCNFIVNSSLIPFLVRRALRRSTRIPLTMYNAGYLRDQRIHFEQGLPAPDFPGGKGESHFVGRAGKETIPTSFGRQAYGFDPFDDTSEFIKKVNSTIAA